MAAAFVLRMCAHGERVLAQGSDWNGQVKLGNSQFVGVNYLQSVTPHLALGGEAFWLGQQRKSGAGFAARYANDAHVATAQLATTGLVSLTYLRRISEKVPRPASPPSCPSWSETMLNAEASGFFVDGLFADHDCQPRSLALLSGR